MEYFLLKVYFGLVKCHKFPMIIVLAGLAHYLPPLLVEIRLDGEVVPPVHINHMTLFIVGSRQYEIIVGRNIQKEFVVDAVFLVEIAEILFEVIAHCQRSEGSCSCASDIPELYA